jgi:hypothetical protein
MFWLAEALVAISTSAIKLYSKLGKYVGATGMWAAKIHLLMVAPILADDFLELDVVPDAYRAWFDKIEWFLITIEVVSSGGAFRTRKRAKAKEERRARRAATRARYAAMLHTLPIVPGVLNAIKSGAVKVDPTRIFKAAYSRKDKAMRFTDVSGTEIMRISKESVSGHRVWLNKARIDQAKIAAVTAGGALFAGGSPLLWELLDSDEGDDMLKISQDYFSSVLSAVVTADAEGFNHVNDAIAAAEELVDMVSDTSHAVFVEASDNEGSDERVVNMARFEYAHRLAELISIFQNGFGERQFTDSSFPEFIVQ